MKILKQHHKSPLFRPTDERRLVCVELNTSLTAVYTKCLFFFLPPSKFSLYMPSLILFFLYLLPASLSMLPHRSSKKLFQTKGIIQRHRYSMFLISRTILHQFYVAAVPLQMQQLKNVLNVFPCSLQVTHILCFLDIFLHLQSGNIVSLCFWSLQ